MRTETEQLTPREPCGVVRWVLHRHDETITCEVDLRSRRHCVVSVVPAWDAPAAVFEAFDDPGIALRRHAEMARRLREHGWDLDRRASTF
jgi:hypothetical protein